MELCTTPEAIRQCCAAWRNQGQSIALVPTMGFLHAGHMSLMDHARLRAVSDEGKECAPVCRP